MHIDMRCGKHDRGEDMANVIKVYYTIMAHDDITGPTRFVKNSQRLSLVPFFSFRCIEIYYRFMRAPWWPK